MHNVLVVVDFQNDFVNGSLGFLGAEQLENNICKKIEEYSQDTIIFTFDTHTGDYLDTREGKALPVPHCVEGSNGWQLYGKVQGLCKEKDICIHKSTFGSLELADHLKKGQYDRVELIGLVSNICVLSNAVIAQAALPGAQIVVDARATGSFDNVLNEKTLDILEGLQVQVINREGK